MRPKWFIRLRKIFVLWHDSYRMYVPDHFMPADEYRAYFSMCTYADLIHAAPCFEQMSKAAYTAGYGECHSGFHWLYCSTSRIKCFSVCSRYFLWLWQFPFYADRSVMGIF